METKNKLLKLEELRGFAAVYVVCHHLFASGLPIFGTDFSFIFRFGQEAVILFFILSGFVIFYSYNHTADKTFSYFFLKRFNRIYIPLLIVFICDYGLLSWYSQGFLPLDIKELLGNLMMLQDNSDKKPFVIVNAFLGNAPLWSLSYEWWFYFLFFGAQKSSKSSGWFYILGIIAATIYIFYPYTVFRILMYFVIWCAGADIAKLYIAKEPVTIKKLQVPLLSLLVIIFILLCNLYFRGKLQVGSLAALGVHPWLEVRHFIFAFVIIAVGILWRSFKWKGYNFFFTPFRYVAPISFALYISHWFLVINAQYLNWISNRFFRNILYIVTCVAFSFVVEKVIYPKLNRFLIFQYKKIKTKSFW